MMTPFVKIPVYNTVIPAGGAGRRGADLRAANMMRKERIVVKLQHLRWKPRWVSHLGCVAGCLEYLGLEISDGWLYGGTGHAFVLNLHEGVCPSGPTAWRTVKLFELAPNLGYQIEGVFGFKGQDDFATVQERAWAHVQAAIDAGLPCYGWELEIPEFYVVNGYAPDGEQAGYYYAGPGCEEGKGPKPWRELGDTGIGVVEMYSVGPCEAADDAKTVREALSFALAHAENPEAWIFEHYRAGLEGFDTWIAALQQGAASDMGVRYNAGVWLECRRNAAAFLQEAQERLPGRADGAFARARAQYQVVADELGRVAEIYPWSNQASDEETLPVDERSEVAVAALQAARAAEAQGLLTLQDIVAVL
jgi:hypothetical protein